MFLEVMALTKMSCFAHLLWKKEGLWGGPFH